VKRAPILRIHSDEMIVDNFAGGGGASLGIEWALGRSPDIAINHDREAIAMHAANHPSTRHYCEDVWKVDPVEACGGRPVGLAWFSPDCKHFSKAKGGKPVDKNIRGLAWVVVRWAKAVKPRVIILENVEEFAHWGPLGPDGKPCPLRKGFTFRRWVGQLRSCGYDVDWRELSACDYGAPTTRKRLFLVARRDGQPIAWPQPTHGYNLLPYRTAAECIDFSLPTYSIFLTREEGKRYGVKRPLADNTMRRIARGVDKFVINSANPFIVPITHTGDGRVHSIEEPLRTITSARRGEFMLATPYLAGVGGRKGQSPETGVDQPYHTITAKADTALVAPYFVSRYGERDGQAPRALPLDRPMPTIVPTQNGAQLVAAFMAKHYGGHETPGSAIGAPIDTITAKDHNALIAAHVSPFYGLKGNETRSGDLFDPLPTVTADPRHALVASHLTKFKGTCQHGQPITEPVHTVQAGGYHYAEVRAFLMKYHGTGGQWNALREPMGTVDATDRFGLVAVHGERFYIADIGMRMLVPPELYLAQSFPPGYIIAPIVDGRPLPKDAQVRMCGNSVPPVMAQVMARAQFEEQALEVVA
jgi:DNA (cytosine-5)-methyltransferase 1